MNPTNAVLEERIAQIEGGLAAVAVSSGQSASALAVQNLCKSGEFQNSYLNMIRVLRDITILIPY